MTISVLCPKCSTADLRRLGIDADPKPPVHCYGTGDEPGTPGLIGSGTWCPCECRRWPHSPMALYDVAAAEHPGDIEAIRDRYHALMVEHGHIVKAKPGEDRNLPCGWPHLPPAPQNASPTARD